MLKLFSKLNPFSSAEKEEEEISLEQNRVECLIPTFLSTYFASCRSTDTKPGDFGTFEKRVSLVNLFNLAREVTLCGDDKTVNYKWFKDKFEEHYLIMLEIDDNFDKHMAVEIETDKEFGAIFETVTGELVNALFLHYLKVCDKHGKPLEKETFLEVIGKASFHDHFMEFAREAVSDVTNTIRDLPSIVSDLESRWDKKVELTCMLNEEEFKQLLKGELTI